ncbi:MAG: UDP-N-acetylglucosamine--N-acetylmuramyl-(pentapeptide) pyrophosphoryl-undecaprenol N-acetylglucosamine transferase [Oscillospiraceae bacterium]|nr:UDP-N-acetylglucosamine--N-acetylmuramyl-(pentapeptide) pyrophosphoryl-undecaprenol N-acetylglucosamine transferase [Oscillospiraceae bacterium]
MRIIFACGGTGGHINPAIALAKMIRERRPCSGVLFVGGDKGMENKLVPREGFEIRSISSRSFSRKMTPAGFWKNVKTTIGMADVLRQAGRIIDEYRPDIVVGTGGYAAFPMVRQAAKRGIKTAIHESNAVPGLATRALAGRVDKVMVGFNDCVKHYRRKDHLVVTGTPVREEFIYTQKAAAKRALELDDRPVVVVYFGSLGAREMNKMMVDYIDSLRKTEAFQLIYATGTFGMRWMPERIAAHGIDLAQSPFIRMEEYIYDMPNAVAAADLLITRSGASTLTEMAVTATPAILIPSPNVTGNQQEKNARMVEPHGGAVVILEKDCNGQRLYETSIDLLRSPKKLEKMNAAMRGLAILDANERIYRTIMDLVDAE